MKTLTTEQRLQWDDEGYLVLEDALAGEELTQLQTAFDRCAEESKPEWLKKAAAADIPCAFFDIPDVVARDDAFIDLADHSSWYGLLMELTDNELRFIAHQARSVPASPVSYTDWHPDVSHDNPLHIKVQVYLNDVVPGAGEFAYVPGSHKKGHPKQHHRPANINRMPGLKRFPAKAGTAIMFNAYGWHTAMDNPNGEPRKSIIIIYEKRTDARLLPDKYKSIEHKLVTPERRRLFQLE